MILKKPDTTCPNLVRTLEKVLWREDGMRDHCCPRCLECAQRFHEFLTWSRDQFVTKAIAPPNGTKPPDPEPLDLRKNRIQSAENYLSQLLPSQIGPYTRMALGDLFSAKKREPSS